MAAKSLRLFALALLGTSVASITPALGQTQSSVPQIVVSGNGEVLADPATAAFEIEIETYGATTTAAGQENARISKDVMDSLAKANMARGDVLDSRLQVHARWEYDDKGRRPRRTDYVASNTIRIKTGDLKNLGNVIDSALAAGASGVSDVTFETKDRDAARREALAKAVVAARLDAEAIARAGGGSLGDLLTLSTEQLSEGNPVVFDEIQVTARRRSRAPVATDMLPGQIKITASVFGRWRFVPSGR